MLLFTSRFVQLRGHLDDSSAARFLRRRPHTQAKMKAGFRNTQWDPIILISQIVATQSLLYVSLGAVMFVMDVLAGANHTLDHLFQYHVRYSV